MAVIGEPDISHWQGFNDSSFRGSRRRPGRVAVKPALIPLLRGAAPLIGPLLTRPYIDQSPVQESFDFGTELIVPMQLGALDDGGNAGRGILLAVVLCTPIWPAIGLMAYCLS